MDSSTLALATRPSALAAPRKKIATVITEYRLNSHADVIAGRLIKGYEYDGKHHTPDVELVSMYTDQVPANDLSRGLAAKYGFKITPTIREALLMGGNKLAVDGVVLIGEHGNYPWNEKEQHMYPRYELFKMIVDVFRDAGQVVPVFSDKHLSYDWDKAKWMYDQSRAMGFPADGRLFGCRWPGGGRPWNSTTAPGFRTSWARSTAARTPTVFMRWKWCSQWPSGARAERDRRGRGAMPGTAPRCGSGPTPIPGRRSCSIVRWACGESNVGGNMREHVKKPALFLVEYRSGLRSALYMLDGQTQAFSVAFQAERTEGAGGHRVLAPAEILVRPLRHLHAPD